jgi:hypothetical protein
MKRRLITMLASVAIAALCAAWPGGASLAASGSGASPAASGGAWGNATELPGLDQLNQGGNASVTSVSCPSPGNCGAGGWYSPAAGTLEAFVASEVNGSWEQPEQVPGSAGLDQGGAAVVTGMSCSSPGDCSATGTYQPSPKDQLPFVATETNGTWGQAAKLAGLTALHTDKYIDFGSVSCASPGNCSAGGSYEMAGQKFQAFVVNQAGGTWGQAQEVPGTAALNAGAHAATGYISCPAAGDCGADGQYTDASGDTQVFVVSESDGTWGTAQELPGLATLNTSYAGGGPLSCSSPGNCGLGGTYTNSSGVEQAFVASQSAGTWTSAQQVPGTATLTASGANVTAGGGANVTAISCPAAGDCAALGSYGGPSGITEAYAVTESKGTWGTAAHLPGTASLSQGAIAYPTVISCASPGNCGAGGYYDDTAGHLQVFVATQTGGTWTPAEEIPGSAALNAGGSAALNVMSCPTVGHCTAGGYYTTSTYTQQGFTATQP